MSGPPDIAGLNAECTKEYNRCWEKMTDTVEELGDKCIWCIDHTANSCNDTEKGLIKGGGCCNKVFPRQPNMSNDCPNPNNNNLIPQRISGWRLSTGEKCEAPKPTDLSESIYFKTFDEAKNYCNTYPSICGCITNYDIKGNGKNGWFTSPKMGAETATDMKGSVAYQKIHYS